MWTMMAMAGFEGAPVREDEAVPSAAAPTKADWEGADVVILRAWRQRLEVVDGERGATSLDQVA